MFLSIALSLCLSGDCELILNQSNKGGLEISSKPMYDLIIQRLSFRESSHNHKAVNQHGYTGQFQLGWMALNDLGYVKPKPVRFTQDQWLESSSSWTGKSGATSQWKFLHSPSLQRKVMLEWIDLIDFRLKKKGTYRLVGKYVKGVIITREGLICAAHLVGVSALDRALKNGNLYKSDSNGVTILEYMKLPFSSLFD